MYMRHLTRCTRGPDDRGDASSHDPPQATGGGGGREWQDGVGWSRAPTLRDHATFLKARQAGREGHPGRCNKRAPQ